MICSFQTKKREITTSIVRWKFWTTTAPLISAREEGMAQEKENNFVAFVKKGLSVKMVADTIGLSKQELTAILKRHPELQGNFA